MFKGFQQLTIKIVNLVNSPRKTQRIIRSASVPRMILKDFVYSIKQMEEKGFFISSLSEVSLRISTGKLLITPKDTPVGGISEECLLTTSVNPERDDELPNLPRHVDWHRSIYLNCEANCVALCQPLFTCIAAGRMRKPEEDILMDAGDVLRMIKCVKLSDLDLKECTEEEGILLIQSIGILVWGKDVDTVVSRIEVLERIYEIEIISTQ